MIPDGQLVQQVLSGRLKSYEKLVHRWTGRVLALCHAKTGRGDIAEDLAQEALLRGFLALRSLVDREKFGPWLCGIATRVCLDWLKERRRSQVSFSELGSDWSPDDSTGGREAEEIASVDEREEISKLLREVENLPDEYREVIMLYYYGDHTYRQLAELLEVSPATVNARLTRGRALLRRRLSPSRR